MKKFNLKMAATVMICGSFLFSSCIGSFGLHSKLVSWNQGIGTKFVNEPGLSGIQYYPGIWRLLSGRCIGHQLHRIPGVVQTLWPALVM
ncbi:DUF3332 domain-containing protein [Bacteroides uniformis]|nr:DUF3332 domain-containing protein [Bacteroides uniformis]